MPSLAEKIARAQAAPKPFRDVDISLDPGVADRIAVIDQELEQLAQDLAAVEADARLSDPRRKDLATRRTELEARYAQIRAEAADSLVTFRFTRLPVDEWTAITTSNPPREGVAVDQQHDFNFHQVGKAAAVASGVEVDGDSTRPVPAETWQELFGIIAGSDLQRICNAIADVNHWSAFGDFLVGRRALSDATETTSNSPTPSE